MAVIAEGYAGVLAMLLNVVGRARGRGITDAAGQALDPPQMLALCSRELIIHIVTLSKKRLLACSVRQISHLNLAASISKYNTSSLSIASCIPF